MPEASGLDELLGGGETSGLDELLGTPATPEASGLDELLATDTSWAEEIAGLAAGIGVGGLATAGVTALTAPLLGPFAPVAGAALGGLAGGLAGRSTENLLEDRPALEGYGATDAAIDLAAGPALMGAGRLIRGARSLANVGDADDIARGATRIGEGLPPSMAERLKALVPDLPTSAPNVDVLKADVQGLSRWGKARRVFSAATALGRAHGRPEARAMSEGLDLWGAIDRRVREQARRKINALERLKLADDEWIQVRAVLRGDDIPTHGFTKKMWQAVYRSRDLLEGYDEWMRKIRHTLRDPDTGDLLNYDDAVPVETVQRYFPVYPNEAYRQRAAAEARAKLGQVVDPNTFRRDLSMGRRVTNLADVDQEHPLAALRLYVEEHTPKIAATHAFGRQQVARQPVNYLGTESLATDYDADVISNALRHLNQPVVKRGEFHDFGEHANRLLASFAQKGLSTQRDRYTFAAFQDALNSIYKHSPTTEIEGAAETGRRLLSTAQLGLSPWRQISQAGTTVMHQGPAASLRGALDIVSDPTVRGFVRESGAVVQPMADFMTVKGFGLRGMIGAAEKALRLHAAATGMRRAQALQSAAARQAARPRGISRAVRKQLAELGLDADTVATRGLDSNDLATAAQYAADRIQFQTYTKGQSGTQLLDTFAGRLFGQYKPFAGSAYRLFHEDVAAPLLSRDPSLVGLGLRRVAGLPAIGAAAGAGELLASLAAGREPDPKTALAYGLGNAFGLPGDVAGNAILGFGLEGQVMPPAINQARRMAQSIDRGRWGRLAIDAAAMHPAVAPFAPALRTLEKEP